MVLPSVLFAAFPMIGLIPGTIAFPGGNSTRAVRYNKINRAPRERFATVHNGTKRSSESPRWLNITVIEPVAIILPNIKIGEVEVEVEAPAREANGTKIGNN